MEFVWKCNDCGRIDFEPYTVRTTYEAYNGVGGLFITSTPLEYDVCPYCESEDIEEIDLDEMEEEEEE